MSSAEGDGWDPIVAAIAEHQARTERQAVFLRDPNEVERTLTARRAFHRALSDECTTPEELAVLADHATGPAFTSPSARSLAGLREDLARHPVRFSPVEPPATAVLLARSYARVSPLAFPPEAPHALLLATDNRYRPHASVQQWDQDRYVLLLGEYVLLDTRELAAVLARLIALAAVEFPDAAEPWTDPRFPDALLATARANPFLHHQIAYGMCAAAEGERYRVAFVDEPEPGDSGLNTDQLGGELSAGALDFLVGHELSHITRGHLHAGWRPVYEYPWYARDTFDKVRPAERVEEYLRRHWPLHSREVEADASAVLCAAGDGPTGAWDLRLMGAQLAISLVSFTDRANHLIKTGTDPVSMVGLRAYGLPGVIDIVLPKPEHPWGRTRTTAVISAARYLYRDFFDEAEMNRKARLMRAVSDVLGSMGAQALHAVRWISQQEGEFVAAVLPDDRLLTLHWPPGFTVGSDEHTQLLSSAARFYGDLAPDLPGGAWVEEDYGRSEAQG